MTHFSLRHDTDNDPEKIKFSRVCLFYPNPPGDEMLPDDVSQRFEEIYTHDGDDDQRMNIRWTVVDRNEKMFYRNIITEQNRTGSLLLLEK